MLYDSIIIGGGPAGMTAGIYLSRKKLNSLLITKDFIGQIGDSSLVENYPGFKSVSGIDLTKQIREHLYENPNTKITSEEVVQKIEKEEISGQNIFTLFTDANRYKAKTVIVATGATYRKLGVLGEKEFYGKGVAHCSICDAPLLQDKFAAVIGGGNSGILAVIDLLPYAKKISLLEYGPELKADPVLIDKIKKEKNVFIFPNSELKEIKGNTRVNAIVFFNHKEKKEFVLPVHGVFIKAGVQPNTSFLNKSQSDLKGLLNKKNEIMINSYDCSTKIPGFFAAGDVTDIRYKQIAIATGEGVKAALSAFEYLKLKVQNS